MQIKIPEKTRELSDRGRLVRLAFAIFASVFTLCVTIQVFLAGLAIFANPENWEQHETFVHLFQVLPLILLALSFFGGLPANFRWQSAVMLGLIYVMYFTANFRVISPYVSAAHPVFAMGLLGISFMVMLAAWKHV